MKFMCCASVAGQDDIEGWISKWEDRLNKDSADVMAAARLLHT